MVAYSFRPQFVKPITVGLGIPWLNHFSVDVTSTVTPKRQTIRAVGRRRHAKAGDELQLYTGMRTKSCRLIGRARCRDVRDIVITFGKLSGISVGGTENLDGSKQREAHYQGAGLDAFARTDGFESWRHMVEFWKHEHGSLSSFTGVIIEWEPIK